jgi:hypothetical protein
MSKTAEDILQVSWEEVAREFPISTNISPLVRFAKVLKKYAIARAAAKSAGRVVSGLTAVGARELVVRMTGDRSHGQMVYDMIENPLTGSLFGNIDALAAMPDEQVTEVLEAAAARKKVATAHAVAGNEAAKEAVVVHGPGSDRRIYRTQLADGVIQRDEFGNPMSRHPDFMRMWHAHQLAYPPKSQTDEETISEDGGDKKKGKKSVRKTVRRTESMPFRSEALTLEQANDLRGFEAHPEEFPDWAASVARARAEGSKAKVEGHKEEHKAPHPDWFEKLSDRAVAMFVAVQIIRPTWYEQVVANDLFGDLMREGMRIRAIEALVAKLCATPAEGKPDTMLLRFRTIDVGGEERMVADVEPEAMAIIERTIDNLGPGQKDVTTQAASLADGIARGIRSFRMPGGTFGKVLSFLLSGGFVALVVGVYSALAVYGIWGFWDGFRNIDTTSHLDAFRHVTMGALIILVLTWPFKIVQLVWNTLTAPLRGKDAPEPDGMVQLGRQINGSVMPVGAVAGLVHLLIAAEEAGIAKIAMGLVVVSAMLATSAMQWLKYYKKDALLSAMYAKAGMRVWAHGNRGMWAAAAIALVIGASTMLGVNDPLQAKAQSWAKAWIEIIPDPGTGHHGLLWMLVGLVGAGILVPIILTAMLGALYLPINTKLPKGFGQTAANVLVTAGIVLVWLPAAGLSIGKAFDAMWTSEEEEKPEQALVDRLFEEKAEQASEADNASASNEPSTHQGKQKSAEVGFDLERACKTASFQGRKRLGCR